MRNAGVVRELNQAVCQALQRDLMNNPPHVPTKGDVSILHLLQSRRHALRLVQPDDFCKSLCTTEICCMYLTHFILLRPQGNKLPSLGGPGQVQVELESWTRVPGVAQRTLSNVVMGQAGLEHRIS